MKILHLTDTHLRRGRRGRRRVSPGAPSGALGRLRRGAPHRRPVPPLGAAAPRDRRRAADPGRDRAAHPRGGARGQPRSTRRRAAPVAAPRRPARGGYAGGRAPARPARGLPPAYARRGDLGGAGTGAGDARLRSARLPPELRRSVGAGLHVPPGSPHRDGGRRRDPAWSAPRRVRAPPPAPGGAPRRGRGGVPRGSTVRTSQREGPSPKGTVWWDLAARQPWRFVPLPDPVEQSQLPLEVVS